MEPNPAGLRSWCATEAALRPGLPLWVVENGMSSRVRAGRPLPRADGVDRPRYVREHLGAVADAVADGVPVRAYLHWSLVDNYEWGTYEPRFGLYGLDRSDPGAVRWMDTDAQGDDAAGDSPGSWPGCVPATAPCWAARLRSSRSAGRVVLGRRRLGRALDLSLLLAAVQDEEHDDRPRR